MIKPPRVSSGASRSADRWAKWPDDYMCPLGELEEHLRPPCARSDDFEVVEVMTYDETGMPSEWRAARHSEAS